MTSAGGAMLERRDTFYGRRKGKPLSPRRARLMADAFRALAIDIGEPPLSDVGALFADTPGSVHLEVGFGGGEHLLAAAVAAPGDGFIGVEPFLNGMANAVAGIVDRKVSNVRLFDGEATLLIDWLPPASLDAVDLFYPDPWPKKRHWKRRFVNDANLDRLARILKPGGVFRFAGDVTSYVEWSLIHTLRHGAFAWTAEGADDWRKPFPGWPGTRYETKAVAAGRQPTYLTFHRC
ncbi:MAG: tRNA (guanine(46)-N(7))-methyltransferase TrmB [Bauldia sp.]